MLTSMSARPDLTMTKIEVTRAFCIAGQPQQVGAVIEVKAHLASELIHMNKAIKATAAPVKPEAVDTETKPATRASRKESTK